MAAQTSAVVLDDNPPDETKTFVDEGDEHDANEHLDDELGLRDEMDESKNENSQGGVVGGGGPVSAAVVDQRTVCVRIGRISRSLSPSPRPRGLTRSTPDACRRFLVARLASKAAACDTKSTRFPRFPAFLPLVRSSFCRDVRSHLLALRRVGMRVAFDRSNPQFRGMHVTPP